MIYGIRENAGYQILAPDDIDDVMYKKGTADDDMTVILMADKKGAKDTKKFSKNFSKDAAGMKKLWSFVKNNIRYKEDPMGHERVKSPARLFSDKVGDCKSFSIFIGSVLKNLGIPYQYKLVKWENNGSWRHIYVVAELPTGKIIMDATHRKYNFEDDYAAARLYNPVSQNFTIGSQAPDQINWTKTVFAFMAGAVVASIIK